MTAAQLDSTTASRCANCGASVASKYCGECGQRGMDIMLLVTSLDSFESLGAA